MTQQLQSSQRTEASKTSTPSNTASHRTAGLLFQLSLIWVVAASLWHLVLSNPDSRTAFQVEVVVFALGAVCSAAIWIFGSDLSVGGKSISLAAFCFLVGAISIQSTSVHALRCRILEPARIQGDEIFHETLGLTYKVPANFRVNLFPLFTNTHRNSSSVEFIRRHGLEFGDTVILSRSIQMTSSQQSQPDQATIILEVQRNAIPDLNAFVLEVRRNEAKYSKIPNIQIIRSTHISHISGLEMVEFEFVEYPQELISRQVFLRNGPFIMNFMLNGHNDVDRALFETFLRSIRIQARNQMF